MIHFDRYRFYKSSDNAIVAVSSFAGKTVRAVAKLHPNDEYNANTGMMLAAARCGEKIAEKRLKRAKKKFAEAVAAVAQATKYLDDMDEYLTNAQTRYDVAQCDLADVMYKIANE